MLRFGGLNQEYGRKSVPEYLTPGVYFEFRDAALPVVRRVRTDITGFIGLAERGPLNQPVQIDTWRQFQARFGRFVPYSFLAYTVKGFFENAGRTCFIVRIAGTTAGKASRTLKNKDNKDVLQIFAMNEGIWGNKIAITLTQVRPSDFKFSLVVTRDGRDRESFPDLSIKPDDKRYFIRIINEGDERTARSQWIEVKDRIPPGIPRTDVLLPDAEKSGLKNQASFKLTEQSLENLKSEGVPDNVLEKLRSLKSYETGEYEITGEEEFLSILRTTIGDEQTIRFKLLILKHTKTRVGFLNAGRDGIASLTKNDFLGNPDPLATDKKGLSAFERVDAVGIVCIPDIHIQPVTELPKAPPTEEPPKDPCIPSEPPLVTAPQIDSDELEKPPVFTEEEILDIQRAMIEHCEQQKDRVAILDAPVKPGGRPFAFDEIRKKWREGFDSERGFGALYYPWVRVVDPLRTGGNLVRAIPPCGHIAGLYARSDFTVGVHKAPANAELFWAEDVTVEVNDKDQDILNPEGINCLRAFPGRGIRVYGARTVSSNPDWRYVNVRRLMLMIEEAVDQATQWAVFEPNGFSLRQLLTLSISSFLETLWREGALVGATKEEAFYVKCDETNNPPEIVEQGKLIADVGVAPMRPMEFIVFRIGRTVEELEIVER
jgi:phage tail sheath protein FI